LIELPEAETSVEALMREMLVCFALLCTASSLPAQSKNDLGLSIGAVLQPSPGATATQTTSQLTQVSFGSGLTFEANYARRLVSASALALELEAPLLAVPSESVASQPAPDVPRNFASLFIVPSIRIRLLPKSRLSPWLSLGGGYARYDESTSLQDNTANPFPRGTNTGALQYGIGADYRIGTIVLPISLRVEARNLYAGAPSLNIQNTSHNHPFLTGGFVLHF
jgi:hypothetical protein